MENTLYIIDPVNFKGNALSFLNSEGLVEHSGYLYNHKGKDLTLEEYCQRVGKHGLIAVDEKEFDEKFMNPYLNNLMGPWEEISEERYDNLLEVLPPKKWRRVGNIESFFMGECQIANLYTACAKNHATGKYYSALRPVSMSNEDIARQVEAMLQTESVLTN